MSQNVLQLPEVVAENTEVSTVIEQNEEEEEDVYFQDIEMLAEHGVKKEDIDKLKQHGINTIKGMQMTLMKKLLTIPGFNEAKIKEIKGVVCKISVSNSFMTANEVSFQRKQVFKLSTGSIAFDKLIGGGIEAMSITEVFGEFRTGKTQLSHTLCVTTQMPGPNGYIGGKVIFIDTEHTFRPNRLRSIAERFDLNQETVLDNILYARAYNSEHQSELLDQVSLKLHEEAGVFKLLIIDSIMATFRVDYSGRAEIFERQHKLAQMMSKLQKMSEEFNIAVLITNQISSNFSKDQLATTKPTGGNILAHASTSRISLSNAEGSVRIARVFDSPDMEEAEVRFRITSGGIDDVEPHKKNI
nr:meiotic recombination protein DMC1/LIM15 homolog [Onthophagus taurus]